MLHITKKHKSPHGKILAAEIFVSVALFAVFISPATQASDITADMVIELVNEARKSAKIAVVKKNQILSEAAQRKADDMVKNDYFAHTSPQGKSPWYWIDESGYDYKFAGENLAINFTSAEEEQQAWMDSPLHRKNILNENYDEIGVAVKEGMISGKNTIVTVQIFGAASSESPVIASLNDEKENIAGAETENLFNSDNLATPNYGSKVLLGWLAVFSGTLLIVSFDVFVLLQNKRKKQSAYALHVIRH